MFPQIFLQWVRAEITQRVLWAAQTEVQAELRARANAQAQGPLPCEVGIVTAEAAEADAIETMLDSPAKFCSDRLSIVQGILRGPNAFRHSNGTEGLDEAACDETRSDDETHGTSQGIRVAIAHAGRTRHAAIRAVEALVNGHRPRYVIVAEFCTAISKKLHAGDLLLADRFVLYDPQNDTYDRELPLRPYEDDDVTGEPIALIEQQEIPIECGGGTPEELVERDADGGNRRNERNGKSREKKGRVKEKSAKKTAKRRTTLRSGPLVTVPRLAELPKTPKAKRRLGGLSDAIAADTIGESVARFCLRRHLPVLVLCGVREEVGEAFPEDVRHYQRHGTKLGRLGAAVGAFLNREGAMTDLNRWNQRGHELSERLADTIVAIVQDGMGGR